MTTFFITHFAIGSICAVLVLFSYLRDKMRRHIQELDFKEFLIVFIISLFFWEVLLTIGFYVGIRDLLKDYS